MVTRQGRYTEEVPAVSPVDQETLKKWHRGARSHARYWKTAITGPFDNSQEFLQQAGEDIDYAIQKSLEWLEHYHHAHMRVVTIEMKFREFYARNDALAWVVITVIAEPLPGEVPLKGPKRQ
jgi:hypothetical protein